MTEKNHEIFFTNKDKYQQYTTDIIEKEAKGQLVPKQHTVWKVA